MSFSGLAVQVMGVGLVIGMLYAKLNLAAEIWKRVSEREN